MTVPSLPAHRLTAACQATLAAWLAPDAGQESLRLSYLQHLGAARDGWARSCPGAHVTASSLVCARGERQVLLTLHAQIGRWLQTGGHLEAMDADLEAAALREAAEESGLSVLSLDPRPLLLSRHEVRCGAVRPTFHLDVQYLVVVERATQPTPTAESTDLQWFRTDQLPDVDDSVRLLVAAAGRRLGWHSAA